MYVMTRQAQAIVCLTVWSWTHSERERRGGACCCCVGCGSRKSSSVDRVVFTHPPLTGEYGGSIAVPIGCVRIATASGSGVYKYPVAVAGEKGEPQIY
jgi:hypothetical protein